MSKLFIMASGNVPIPAYLALRQKGYSVQRIREGSETTNELWEAQNASSRLVAEDTIMLLGLASLYETRGQDWKASDVEIEAFLSEFYPKA